jgi:DNA processing protein
MDPKVYWIGFNYVKGIGAVRLQTLLDAFGGDLQAAWRSPPGKRPTTSFARPA